MEERVTLFNSVLSANPAYYLSEKRSNSLKIPLKGISKKNVGYSLDPWDDVHQKKKNLQKKEFGGFRIINLTDFNLALLVKEVKT